MISDKYSKQYLQNLLEGNRAECSSIAKKYLKENPSLKDLYEHVLKTSLYEIGKLWEVNKINVATEHMATAITEGILNELFQDIIPSQKFNKKVVVTCVENERHQVGIKMVADIFESQGWDSYFLGSGIPNQELFRFITDNQPDIIAISLSIYFNYTHFIKMVKDIKQQFPNIIIIIGGQAFNNKINNLSSQIDQIHYFSDLYLLENYIKSLNYNNYD